MMQILVFLMKVTPKAHALELKFSQIKEKEWDIRSYMDELIVQLGQLLAILYEEFSTVVEKERPLDTIEDELCDILLSLIYLASEQEFKIEMLEEATQEKSAQVLDLFLLASQISESYMEITGERFRKLHEGKTPEDFFKDRIVRMMTICFNIAREYKIDLHKAFDNMCIEAMEFVERKVEEQRADTEQLGPKLLLEGFTCESSK